MSVILVTGQPGSGKTALVVDMLAHDPQFEGRPIFVTGVPDLTIDHSPCPPVEDWTEKRQSPDDPSLELAYFTFPEGALVVIDEAQRIYRPRAVGSKVPDYVAAFETHRHTGVDFILITQHAGLIDSNIRKLIGRHIHVRVTPFGRKKYEWTELGDPESVSSRELAASESYKLPKRAFSLYKSSQLHTKIKVKLPWYFYMFIIGAFGAAALGWYGYHRVTSKLDKPTDSRSAESSLTGTPAAAPVEPKPMDATAFLMASTPVVSGRPETAPMYDGLRQVKQMEQVVGCFQTRSRCTCVNQQGLDAHLDPLQCREWLASPPFNPYVEVAQRVEHATPASRPEPSVASAPRLEQSASTSTSPAAL